MPAIRSQAELIDGFEVETVEYGKRKVTFLELGGNLVTLFAYLNDVLVAQQTFNNPSLTTIYTWVAANLFPGETVSADGKTINVGNGHLYVSWHVFQRNPLQLRLMTSNAPSPANWWQ